MCCKQDANRLEIELKQVKISSASFENDNKQLQAELNDLQTRLNEETSNSKKLSIELTALQATVEEANSNITFLTSAKKKLEAELNETKSETEELIAAKAVLESKLERFKEEADEKMEKLEKEKNALKAQLQDALFKIESSEERAGKNGKKKLEQVQQHREYLKSLKSPISTLDHKLSFMSRDMKCNQKQHLMICNMEDSSVVEWDPQTSRTINSVKLDSNPNSIAIDFEGNQWIVCSDGTVRKRQREDQEFVIQFTLDRSTKIYRIRVTKKGKVIIQNNEKVQIEIWEQSIATSSDGWFWNTTTTTQKKWKQTRCISSSFGSKFDYMGQFVVDSRDRIIVCNSNNNRVVVLTDELKDVIDLSTRFKFDDLQAVAVDEMDNIFVAEWKSKRVVVFDCEGNHLNTFNHSIECEYIEVMNDSIYVKYFLGDIQELKLK